MPNFSPVDHLYKFGRASTESDDLAAQILYLTENLRILENDNEQWDDVYDTIEKEELADLIDPSKFAGTYHLERETIQSINPTSVVGPQSAISFSTSKGSTANSPFSWSSDNSSIIRITSGSTNDKYLFFGRALWSSGTSAAVFPVTMWVDLSQENTDIGSTAFIGAWLAPETSFSGTHAVTFSAQLSGAASESTVRLFILHGSTIARDVQADLWMTRLK